MALDERKEGDVETRVNDFTFVLEEGLEESFGKFTVDYSDNWLRRGFTVIPDRAAGGC
nr:hypothetical protein [Tissierella sp.]